MSLFSDSSISTGKKADLPIFSLKAVSLKNTRSLNWLSKFARLSLQSEAATGLGSKI